MAQQPSATIVVTGATGKQGGGVVDALLNQGKFHVRAITRDPQSDKGKALAARGVDVVQGDLTDKASLVKAFSGAHGAFLFTDAGTARGSAEAEYEQGKNGVDAAKEAGIQHLVWSGLEDPRKLKGVSDELKEVAPGRLIPHFEGKAEVTEYLQASGVPATVLLTSAFYDNFVTVIPFIPQGDGSYAIFMNAGDKGHSFHESTDVGATTAAALADPDKYIGKTLPVVRQRLSLPDATATISKVTGKNLKFVDVPDEKAAAAPFPGAKDLANMWRYYRLFDHFNDLRPLDGTIVKGKSFEQWAQDNKEALAARFK